MKAITLVGSGGQGIQSAAVILAEAAIAGGAFAACTHTYGPESRGGASRASVLIDDAEIVFPRAERPDVLVVLSSEGRREVDALRVGGVLICDQSVRLEAPPAGETFRLPLIQTAKSAGAGQGANMVALGALCAITGIVSRDSLTAALSTRFRANPARNQRALEAGIELAARCACGQPLPNGEGRD